MSNLDKLFYPENICLIGVSDVTYKGVTPFLYSLKKVNFDKPIYCVNRQKSKVMFNIKAYQSIFNIPDEIDYVIIGVPRSEVPQIVKECNEKGVKFVTVFTAGFSELGTEEGRKLEIELLKHAKNLRLIGPNCLGVYCQDSRLAVTETLKIQKKDGEIAFICQSGGHTGTFYYIAENKGFSFNKMVSIGNQCDLTIQDFIEYFNEDPKIKVITSYIEQVKKPKEFLNILRNSAQKKPVICWKGGQTEEGNLASASHTGAVSSSYEIFKAAIEQNGGIVAECMEELADLTLGALFLSNKKLGENLGIIVPGGGSCVELMDNATKSGLNVPEFTPETRNKIQEIIQEVNTSTRNPVDLGMFGWLPIIISKTMAYAAEDPNIDVVIFYYMIERLPRFAERLNDRRLGKTFLNRFSRVIKKYSKPFICIIPNFINTSEEITEIRKSVVDKMSELRVPFFETMEKAANVIKKLLKYQQFLDRIKKK